MHVTDGNNQCPNKASIIRSPFTVFPNIVLGSEFYEYVTLLGLIRNLRRVHVSIKRTCLEATHVQPRSTILIDSAAPLLYK